MYDIMHIPALLYLSRPLLIPLSHPVAIITYSGRRRLA